MSCPCCGQEYFDADDAEYCKELDIFVCADCLKKIEEHHKVDGKYVVRKCKACGHVKGVDFIKYKKKGRPAGSKNKETVKRETEMERLQRRITDNWKRNPKLKKIGDFVYV